VPDLQSLATQIQATLGAAVRPTLTSASAVSDLFEGYLFCVVVAAARAEGARVEYENVDGTPATTFTFRTSPGQIFSRAQPYSYATIEFAGKPMLELHMGVQVSGKSGVLHECDVAVIWHDEAETCRVNRVAPRSHKVLLAVECKHYGDHLPLGLARAFHGLSADLSTQECYFVSNIGSRSIEKYLTKRSRKWYHRIRPQARPEVERLRNSFRTAFVHFKATN
jgi:hypothetical protein